MNCSYSFFVFSRIIALLKFKPICGLGIGLVNSVLFPSLIHTADTGAVQSCHLATEKIASLTKNITAQSSEGDVGLGLSIDHSQSILFVL